MSGFGRADSPRLTRDGWLRPLSADEPAREPVLRRVSAWFLGPAVLSAVWWTVSSPHFEHPEFRAALLAYAIAAPALIGLLWWTRRPKSSLGPLLTAFGFAAWPLCLQGSADPLLFSIGVLAEAPYAFLTFLICLAYPHGRISSTFESGLLVAWGVVLVIGWIPFLAMLPSLEGGGPLSACAPNCPPNSFQVMQPSGGLLELVGQVGIVLTVAFGALLMGQQVVRLALATPARRGASWPVVATTGLFLVAFTGYHLYRGLAPLSPTSMSFITAFYVGAFVFLPLGFLVALVRADLFAARAARRLGSSLSFVSPPSGLRDSLSLALGDPGLRFGTWSAADQRYVQPDGSTLVPPRPAEQGQIWVPVTRNGQRVAAFVADEALATETRLLDTAASAALVAIGDGQIAEDAMALRAEVVSATDSERQRIARDMHDSAQQRLVALRVQVGLASEHLEGRPEEQALMHRLGRELDYAIEEVRDVARRFLGPLVVRNGLGPALRSITRAWPLTVHVDDRGLSRHNPTSELTVYNLCLEALQNSLEHGGKGVTAHVRIKDADTGIWFSVTDNGVGFDPQVTSTGPGLAGMTDRALLVGGTVSVHAAIGSGVTVSGKIPDPPARALTR